MNGAVFIETQSPKKYPIWWISFLAPLLILLPIYCYQLFTGVPVGNHPLSNFSFSILILIYLLLAVCVILFLKLSTKIYDDKILYGWNFPTSLLNEIKFADIKTCKIVEYSFVGYGYRVSRKYGLVYSISGNCGLQIETKSGEKILIGTNRKEGLAKILEQMKF